MSLTAKLGHNIRRLRHRRKSSVASHWYLPIDTHRGEIRLLHLLPGEWNDVITVYTSKARLPLEGHERSNAQRATSPSEPAPLVRSYEALSYTWGSKEQCIEISLDGKFGFSLTRNLWLALRRLRLENDIRFLWVDAICINQQDTTERSAQIQLMGLVFKYAAEVTVWLGECFDSEERIEATEHNVNFYEESSHALQMAVRNTTPSWWTRAWVVQEFVSASKIPVVQFGPYRIEWAQLGILSSSLITRMGAHTSAISLPAAQADMEKARDLVKRGKGTLSQLLRILGDLQASDDRDTVYSLLGMIDPEEAYKVYANYEDSTTIAFAKATYASILSSKSYDILMLLSFSDEIARPAGLPSWAFNFAFGGDRKVKIDDWNRVLHGRVDSPANQLMRSEAIAWTVTHASRTNEVAAGFYAPTQTLTVHGLYFDYVADLVTFDIDIASESSRYWKSSQLNAGLRKLLTTFQTGDPYGDLPGMPAKADRNSPASFSEALMQTLEYVHESVYVGAFRHYFKILFQKWQALASNSTSGEIDYRLFEEWLDSLKSRKTAVAVFVTRHGFIGIASGNVKMADTIALWTGCLNPAVLRHYENARYTFQGFAYIHGIMDGELLVHASKAQLPETRFVLV